MDSKKLFPENKSSKKRKFLEFIDKKGFYVVLILCVLIVGVTAVLLTTKRASPSNTSYENQKIIPEGTGNSAVLDDENSNPSQAQSSVNTDSDKNAKASGSQTAENKDLAANTLKSKTTTGTAIETGQSAKATVQNSSKTTSAKAPAPKKKEASQKFLMPVFGQISFGYAQDKLVYSKTLEDWRTHSGVDIAAERGTPVKAVADGVVTDIKNDPQYGVIVKIDHKDGTKSVYANLASDDAVSPNQKVKQGDVIGAVGNSASLESAEQSHLHFEVLKSDENVDPVAYLPKAVN
ncbi:MAG TPA: M23 family metallopeptidase [Clostridia bacterium]|nr:M23 family metallopeptidase [Clostridia bacterium]